MSEIEWKLLQILHYILPSISDSQQQIHVNSDYTFSALLDHCTFANLQMLVFSAYYTNLHFRSCAHYYWSLVHAWLLYNYPETYQSFHVLSKRLIINVCVLKCVHWQTIRWHSIQDKGPKSQYVEDTQCRIAWGQYILYPFFLTRSISKSCTWDPWIPKIRAGINMCLLRISRAMARILQARTIDMLKLHR